MNWRGRTKTTLDPEDPVVWGTRKRRGKSKNGIGLYRRKGGTQQKTWYGLAMETWVNVRMNLTVMWKAIVLHEFNGLIMSITFRGGQIKISREQWRAIREPVTSTPLGLRKTTCSLNILLFTKTFTWDWQGLKASQKMTITCNQAPVMAEHLCTSVVTITWSI